MFDMLKGRKIVRVIGLFLLCGIMITLSGCAILQIPAKAVEGTFSLLREAFKLIQKLPKPPPGVF